MGGEPISDVTEAVVECHDSDLGDWCGWVGTVVVTWVGRSGQWTCPRCCHVHDLEQLDG